MKVELKTNERATIIDFKGTKVPAVTATQIKRVILKHENEKARTEFFELEPKKIKFKMKVPIPEVMQSGGKGGKKHEWLRLSVVQLPIIANNATTGHKLQGATLKEIFVQVINNTKNWLYVVVSRVKTLEGLFLRQKIKKSDLKIYNAIPEKLTKMLGHFKKRIWKKPFEKKDYINIIGKEKFAELSKVKKR